MSHESHEESAPKLIEKIEALTAERMKDQVDKRSIPDHWGFRQDEDHVLTKSCAMPEFEPVLLARINKPDCTRWKAIAPTAATRP